MCWLPKKRKRKKGRGVGWMGRQGGSGRNRDREETITSIYYVEFLSIKKEL